MNDKNPKSDWEKDEEREEDQMKERESPEGKMCSPKAREENGEGGGWKDQYLISVLSSLWTAFQ